MVSPFGATKTKGSQAGGDAAPANAGDAAQTNAGDAAVNGTGAGGQDSAVTVAKDAQSGGTGGGSEVAELLRQQASAGVLEQKKADGKSHIEAADRAFAENAQREVQIMKQTNEAMSKGAGTYFGILLALVTSPYFYLISPASYRAKTVQARNDAVRMRKTYRKNFGVNAPVGPVSVKSATSGKPDRGVIKDRHRRLKAIKPDA